MCGIAGMYGLSLGKTEKNIFFNLLLLNYFRGEDSTGVVRIEPKNIRTLKSLMPSPEFLYTERGANIIYADKFTEKGEKPIGFIGHCRAATRGKVAVENAHPFRFPNVVGVHNGTIKDKFDHWLEYDTDSEAVFKNLNDKSLEETIKEINQPDSAYVLVWTDKRDNTLNFIRNSKRPLYMTFIYSRTTLIWSSEKGHLQLALRKAGLSAISGIKPTDTKDTDAIFQLGVHQHMKVPLNGKAGDFTITDLNIEEAKSKTTTTYYSGHYYDSHNSVTTTIRGPDGCYRSWSAHQAFMKEWNKKKEATVSPPYKNHHAKSDAKSLQSLAWLTDPVNQKKGEKDNNSIGQAPKSSRELEFKLSQGCFCCGTKVTMGDHKAGEKIGQPAAIWYTRDYYACSNCYENSPGDWLKYALEELLEGTATAPLAGGVSVH